MNTVVELPEFLSCAKPLLSQEDKRSLINYLAAHPLSGVVMQGTGGIRKLRWAIGNKGKSGGVRVVYFYHDKSMPLFLLSIFSKSSQVNLSKVERNELSKGINTLLKTYRRQP